MMPDSSPSSRHNHAWKSAILIVLALVLLQPFAKVSAQAGAPSGPRPHSALDVRNQLGLTPLIVAASAGDADTVKSLLAAGAGVDATSADGRTPLIAAIQSGQQNIVPILIAAGANLDLEARFVGSPLNIAENKGDTQIAALLMAAGAHSTGKSVGDTVCVRPWGGEGYCGVVKSFSIRSVQLRLTRLVGCAGGCAAREECSASAPVGGANGLQVGDKVAIPSWCLTQTGVKQ
jgi:Ankyrin repeats (3 copies)